MQEAEARLIRLIDEEVNDADKIIFADPVFRALGEKHRLTALNPAMPSSSYRESIV